ncbi:MAG: universal stress protein [Bacteroidales bacterium]|nr:universal stress protein [Bacteroidales bacterium]HPD96193.1 universal stress protein [Tenuifilaceae bacterium]HRX30277.1 universal stress protein [Tenuifilaceae bacterium]
MKEQQSTILIPVDFKDHFKLAVEFGKKLAPTISAEIHLLYVLDLNEWWLEDVKPEKIVNDAFNKLVKVSKEFQLPEKTKYSVLQGKRHEKIVSYANEIGARYILMVDNYPNARGEQKLGATLSNVIISAKQPVITVKSVTPTILKRILVPLDLTKDCRLKLFNSIAIALAFDSSLHITSVVFGDIKPEDSRINDKMNKYQQFYKENNILYSTKILQKDEDFAYRAIIEYAQDIKCDAIIIMTHRESVGIDNYLGAFAHHIINESPIPVITLNSAASGEQRNIIKSILDPLNLF